MDDIPQGGSGGVPGHHDGESDDDRRGPDEGAQPVKTVRAGAPVAEQKADKADGDEADGERPGTTRPDG